MRRIIIILLLFILFSHVCMAESFFPSTNELFGQAMPSISSVTGKEATAEERTGDGTIYTYNGFSTQDYIAFSRYLAEQGCSVDQVTVENKVLIAVISKDNINVLFTYDYPSSMASMLYPDNTRKEDNSDSKLLSDSEVGVLPDVNHTFGAALPSLNLICNIQPEIKSLKNGLTQYSYKNVTEKQYNAFCCYLTEIKCNLVESSFNRNILTATVEHDGGLFNVAYNNSAYTVDIIYPELFYIDDKEYEGTSAALLPTADQLFGTIMPRIDIPTGLEAVSKSSLVDGGYEETYLGFSDVEYKKFSNYLKDFGCIVSDYSTDENGVLIITMTKDGIPFSFHYNRALSQATIRYVAGTRPEPTLTPKPTVEPTPVPGATPNDSFLYSKNECYSVAEDYLKSVLKNPNSLQIHSSRTITYDETYCFVFDYSAQNSFGGYTRSEAYIWITKATKSVYWSDFK